MSESRWVHLNVERVQAATEKAALCFLEDREEEVWIPFSQMEDPDNVSVGDKNCTISVTRWWAEKQGIEDEG
jgi:hypothetical protein